MLSASIKIKSSISTFRTLPLPESCKGQAKEADVILPLLFEVALEVSLQDRTDSVTLRAPGTISGKIKASELFFFCLVVYLNTLPKMAVPRVVFSRHLLLLQQPFSIWRTRKGLQK
jgi:hypothetical protein